MLKTIRSESFLDVKEQLVKLQIENTAKIVSEMYDGSYYCLILEVNPKEEEVDLSPELKKAEEEITTLKNSLKEKTEAVEEGIGKLEAFLTEINELKKERTNMRSKITKLENQGG